MIHAAIAAFELQPPLDRLDVGKDGLRLHGDAPARARDHRIPCPEIPFHREPNLGAPEEDRVDHLPQPLQEPLLAGVSDRIAGWVGSHSNVEADGCSQTGHDPRINRARRTVQDPADRRRAEAAWPPQRTLAQPARPPAGGDLPANPRVVSGNLTPGSFDTAVPDPHRASFPAGASPWLMSDFVASDARRVAQKPGGRPDLRNSEPQFAGLCVARTGRRPNAVSTGRSCVGRKQRGQGGARG